MKTLIIWRHGQTDYNLQLRVQGQVDVALNERGLRQAEAASRELARLELSRIVASPLTRALQTAETVASRLGLPVETDARLQERNFGAWEGLTAEEIRAGWPNDFTSWRDWGDPDPLRTGVEPRRDVGKRVAGAWRDYAQEMEPGQTILFVSHGSACTQGVTELLEIDPSDWFGLQGLDNCHWAVLQSTKRKPGWRISAYNLGVEETRIL